jgi:IrrE N-terminal-like domain
MAFRRGFKSQCERRAVEFRRQFGVSDSGPLSADRLAKELNVVVMSSNDVRGLSGDAKAVLADDADDSWLALTMRMGARHLVIHKPVRKDSRRNSIVMHELSHTILGHQLAAAFILDDGSMAPGNFNQEQEYEADWLAGTLLLPRPALLSIRRRALKDHEACDEHLVSLEMLRWRMQMTGVASQLGRRTA